MQRLEPQVSARSPVPASSSSTVVEAMVSIVSPLGPAGSTVGAASLVARDSTRDSARAAKQLVREGLPVSPHISRGRAPPSQPVPSGQLVRTAHTASEGLASSASVEEHAAAGGSQASFGASRGGFQRDRVARSRATSDVGERALMPSTAASWSLGHQGWASGRAQRVVRGLAGRTRSQQRRLESSGLLSARSDAASGGSARKVRTQARV
jgi:hypothetical protein